MLAKCSCCLIDVLHYFLVDILFIPILLPCKVKMPGLHLACFCIALSGLKITVVLIKSVSFLTHLLFFLVFPPFLLPMSVCWKTT